GDEHVMYTGKELDEDTGLYYYNARWYIAELYESTVHTIFPNNATLKELDDPNIGRFTTEDPIRSGLNWYAYANNNPLRFVDPSGLSWESNVQEDKRKEVVERAERMYGHKVTGGVGYISSSEKSSKKSNEDTKTTKQITSEQKNIVQKQLNKLGIDISGLTDAELSILAQFSNLDDIKDAIGLIKSAKGLKNLSKIAATIDPVNALKKGCKEMAIFSIVYSSVLGEYDNGYELAGEIVNNTLKSLLAAGAGVLVTKAVSTVFNLAASITSVGTVMLVGQGLDIIDTVLGSPVKTGVANGLSYGASAVNEAMEEAVTPVANYSQDLYEYYINDCLDGMRF
ncbi:MAG: RHS repeat-associated core domain-containing protein, partial [Spirochaetales bacterium]|nr:RHS repeat-associated core domain-containing protein [Spirochaetales bacterium]